VVLSYIFINTFSSLLLLLLLLLLFLLLPPSLPQKRKSKEAATRLAELEAVGYATWVEARKSNDFGKFVPVLKEIIELKKEVAKVGLVGMVVIVRGG